MKNTIYNLRIAAAAAVLWLLAATALQSCQKSAINGDLDGQWQVMEVTPAPEETPITERMYYCFYLHTCNLTYYGGSTWASARMAFDGGTLTLTFTDKVASSKMAELGQYGITRNPAVFKVATLTDSRLVLKDGDVTVTMRKF